MHVTIYAFDFHKNIKLGSKLDFYIHLVNSKIVHKLTLS